MAALACGADPAAPAYDATGTWDMRMAGPRPVAGDCDLVDDQGYAQRARITQDGPRFTITASEGEPEAGSVDGATYTQASALSGQAPDGTSFDLATSTRFTLSSAGEASGQTELDIRYADGTYCTMVVAFTARKEP
jgi:hypothetical protein